MFYGTLKHCDGIVFSGGIAQRSPVVRRKICDELQGIGLVIDETLNKKNATIISSKKHNSPKIFVIPTNEELMIARKALQLIAK
jgi:acetate kinase